MENITRNEIISFVIDRIFDLADKVTKQLKVEKKETGQFSGMRSFVEDEFAYCFALMDQYGNTYPDNRNKLIPPASKNFMMNVLVKRDGYDFFTCRVERLNSNSSSYNECMRTTKWLIRHACDCDESGIVPLFHTKINCAVFGYYGVI